MTNARKRLSFAMTLRIAALALVVAGCAAASPQASSVSPSAHGAAPAAPRLTSQAVDDLLRGEWQKRGIIASAPVDDATYLRRVWLDVAGVIPPPERVLAFESDKSPSREKRARAVAELLASREYADHMTVVWDDLLMGRARAGDLDRPAFRVWLHDRFEKNTPWNETVYALVAATGVQSPGKAGRTAAEVERAMVGKPDVSGAVNYALRFRNAPQDFAGNASKVFLATQIQCAQCHDHKTEKWTQQEFQSFAASFARVEHRIVQNEKGARIVDVQDGDRPAKRFANDPDLAAIAKAEPRALDGAPMTGNARASIAKWISTNPALSRAFVNRMWGHFLGRGFVNPVDDIRPSNPAEMRELLDRLADDFARGGYDVKKLIALITSTEAYQLSANANANEEIPLWSRFRMTPLGAEELATSLLAATGADAPLRGRGADAEDVRYRLTQLFSFTFDVDEEFEQTRYEGTLAQALVLLNGTLTKFGASAQGNTAVAAIARSPLDDAGRVTALFVRTLSRKPTADELAKFVAYLENPPPVGEPPPAQARPAPAKKLKGQPNMLARLRPPEASRDPKTAALEDIAWALLNSSEFALNH